MATCTHCQRPACDFSTRACTEVDCGLRANPIHMSGASSLRQTAASFPERSATAGGDFYGPTAVVAGNLADQFARDGEANGLVGVAEGLGIHDMRNAA